MTGTQTQHITLSVPDISCEHCVHTINSTLGVLAGVETVQTDIPSKTVLLTYHPDQISLEQVEQILDDAGYTVTK